MTPNISHGADKPVYNEELCQQVRDGLLAIENTGSVPEINKLLKHIFPDDSSGTTGDYKYYAKVTGVKPFASWLWDSYDEADLPSRPVSDFLVATPEKGVDIYSKGFIYTNYNHYTQRETINNITETFDDKIEVLSPHPFKDGQEVIEGKDYELGKQWGGNGYWINEEYYDGPREGERTTRLVAIPIDNSVGVGEGTLAQKANSEAKAMAEYYFKGDDSRKQAIVIGFNDGVNWLLRLLSQRKVKDKDFIAKNLRDNGFTIREIAKIMGYKHPGSISHLLNTANETPPVEVQKEEGKDSKILQLLEWHKEGLITYDEVISAAMQMKE